MCLLDVPEASGQTTRPDVYAWDSLHYFATSPDPNLKMMIEGWVTTPEATAAGVCGLIRNYVFYSGHLAEDQICIVLQNFAAGDEGAAGTTHLFHPDDGIEIDPLEWIVQQGHNTSDRNPNRNPWLDAGITRAATWMEGFLDAYDAWWANPANTDELPLGWVKPVPKEFRFDTEVHVAVVGGANYSFLLERTSLDPRWTDPNHPIRGFTKTGQELWDEAATVYGWPGTVAAAVNHVRPTDDFGTYLGAPFDNQKPYLWWSEICSRVIETAMKECAYDVIKAHDPADPRWALVKCSDYQAANADGATDSLLSWHQVRLFNDGARSPHAATNPVWRRTDRRAMRDESWHSAHPSALVDPALVANEVVLLDNRQPVLIHWSSTTRTRRGDFSAPPLYAAWNEARVRQPVVYLKLDPGDNDFNPSTPVETEESRWMSTMRVHRLSIESMIGTESDAFEFFQPWVQPPLSSWANPNIPPVANDTFTREDFRNQLAYLQGVNVQSLSTYNASGCFLRRVWNPQTGQFEEVYTCATPGNPFPSGWVQQFQAFAEEYAGVYGPRVASFGPGLGHLIGDTLGVLDDPERLWYTLPRGTGAARGHYSATIQSKKPFWNGVGYLTMYPAVSETIVDFENVESGNYSRLQLNIEAEVKATPGMPMSRNAAGQATTLRGQVFAWDWNNNAWIDITRTPRMQDRHPEIAYEGGLPLCVDCPPGPIQYGFYTPGAQGMPDAQDATRRFFLFPHSCTPGTGTYRSFVNAGRVRVKLVHLLYEAQPAPDLTGDGVIDPAFTTKFDLVQLVNVFTGAEAVSVTPCPPEDGGGMIDSMTSQGADVDFSGAADMLDAELFMAEWSEGAPAADFDQSGIIDGDDVIEFVEALVEVEE